MTETRANPQCGNSGRHGQATVEYALIYAGVILPITFALIFTAQLLWVWHSVGAFTRDGARFASTHCWQSGASNVLTHMRSNVPMMTDREQFQTGQAEIDVRYWRRDPESGELTEFTCEGGECSAECIPDTVQVRIVNYEFRHFMAFLGLPPIPMPDFQTTLPMESAGCNQDEEGVVTCVAE